MSSKRIKLRLIDTLYCQRSWTCPGPDRIGAESYASPVPQQNSLLGHTGL
jgi:hypothetical protein